MGFQNPIVGGTALRIPAIQSPNYNPGVLGWIIKQNGDAEFNNLTIRGQFNGNDFIINSDGIFIYSGTPAAGNLIGSWTAASGTDAFGNAYQAGLTLYSSQGTINFTDSGGDVIATWTDTVNGSVIDIGVGGGAAGQHFTPPTTGGVTWQSAAISAVVSNVFGAHTFELAISGGYNAAHVSAPTIALFGSSDTSAQNRIDLTTQQANVSGDLTAGSMDSGSFSITPTVAGQWTNNTAVSFNKTFSSAPVVMVTPSANGPGSGTTTKLEWQTTGVTTTGFNCRILRDNTSATTLSWLAILT